MIWKPVSELPLYFKGKIIRRFINCTVFLILFCRSRKPRESRGEKKQKKQKEEKLTKKQQQKVKSKAFLSSGDDTSSSDDGDKPPRQQSSIQRALYDLLFYLPFLLNTFL